MRAFTVKSDDYEEHLAASAVLPAMRSFLAMKYPGYKVYNLAYEGRDIHSARCVADNQPDVHVFAEEL